MKPVTAAALLHLCFCATAAVSVNGTSETALTAVTGDIVILPCYIAGNVTPSVTKWSKNGREVISGGGGVAAAAAGPEQGASPGRQRFEVLRDGSLNIQEVSEVDEGSYLCDSSLPNNSTFQATVRLQVVSGPENVSLFISPVTALPNGTSVVFRGSTVYFMCSSFSYPSQQLSWGFSGDSFSNDSLFSGTSSWLEFRIDAIQPSDQGVYSCRAQNTVSNQTASSSSQLIVYYAPERHPECQWASGDDPFHIQFICTWFGGYPSPALRWEGRTGLGQTIYASGMTESLSVMLNRSLLYDGQRLTCTARHPALQPARSSHTPTTCSFTLKPPYPEGEPLVTALEASSVTLSCTESSSIPPGNTTWKKGLQQDNILSGSKYTLSEQGPIFSLTILNVSKEDEGVYFCRSENPLGVRELEVYLTVKPSSAYTGAIIGIFIAALIVGSAFVVAKTVYSSRHRICLGSGFGQMEEDGGDVLSLVDSDDEQIFQDAVPRLPPLTNGHQTTMVQIHRIPSSDHEDTVVADTTTQLQEDTELTEGPVDLVTF
ncbi:V-set and immunoglobulin domain-containing protein 10 [Genypterus blacodes]|uniref:V-set and immunoglobulin domain-containing protein 10 n=1 Tax=Genypterus blacodes TaxID=154954 RepID=UPI003F76CC06